MSTSILIAAPMGPPDHDVLIIGGGPAGSSLAWGLRDTGLRPLIVDKKSFPRDKTCAGWITPAVVETLQMDLADYQRRNTLQAIRGFRVGTMQGQTMDIDFGDSVVSYGIRRCELDHYLLSRSGATFQPGFDVRAIRRGTRGWVINDRLEAELLVGAGGNFCPVARLLGARPGRAEAAVHAQEIEFKMDGSSARNCAVDPAIPELYFCNDLKGYGWVFRKDNYLNIGLGRLDDRGLPAQVQEFYRFLQRQRRVPADIPGHLHGHAYLLYDHSRRPLYGDGLLLIGDSAGLAYNQSGEGIRPAVESALIAAGVITAAGGDYSGAMLGHYQDQITTRFGERHSTDVQHRLLPLPLKQWLAEKLLGMDWFVKNIVIGDWFLHRRQARLQPPPVPGS